MDNGKTVYRDVGDEPKQYGDDVTLDVENDYRDMESRVSLALLGIDKVKDGLDFVGKVGHDQNDRIKAQASVCIEELGKLLALLVSKKDALNDKKR